jgi:hypothetical protein
MMHEVGGVWERRFFIILCFIFFTTFCRSLLGETDRVHWVSSLMISDEMDYGVVVR